jgi:RHS repeat-associated protein
LILFRAFHPLLIALSALFLALLPNAQDVKAEFIWMSPMVGASTGSAWSGSLFGGDGGLGGYMPLAVATPTGVTAGATDLAWVHASHMGVPIRYSDASGTTLPAPTSYAVPGFPGQARTFADLYYNRYRDYDTSTGRYIQADPIGLAGGPSPYSYALNNPLRYTDPLGLMTYWEYLTGTPDSYRVDIMNGIAGLSDSATFGATNWVREQLGINGEITDCNDFYGYGELGSLVLGGGAAAKYSWKFLRRGNSQYDDLLRAAQQKYPNKAGRIENHHIEPLYLGGAKNGTTAPLDAAYHQMITNAFRGQHAYGRGRPSPERLREIMEEVYRNFPLP